MLSSGNRTCPAAKSCRTVDDAPIEYGDFPLNQVAQLKGRSPTLQKHMDRAAILGVTMAGAPTANVAAHGVHPPNPMPITTPRG